MKASRIMSCLVVCAVTSIALAASTHLPKTNTRGAIEAYVQQAAAVVKSHGPSCATFASPEWRNDSYYVFVIGPDDKLVCHATAALIGKPQSTIVSSKGEKVGEMIVTMGKGNGKGWVEYHWAPPGKTKEELKSSYVMGVTGPDGKHYVVGAGGFNVTK